MTLLGIVNAMRKYRFNIGTHLPRRPRGERPSAHGKLSRRCRRVPGARLARTWLRGRRMCWPLSGCCYAPPKVRRLRPGMVRSWPFPGCAVFEVMSDILVPFFGIRFRDNLVLIERERLLMTVNSFPRGSGRGQFATAIYCQRLSVFMWDPFLSIVALCGILTINKR